MRVYVYVYVSVCVCMCMCVCVRVRVRVRVRARARARERVRVHVYVYVYVYSIDPSCVSAPLATNVDLIACFGEGLFKSSSISYWPCMRVASDSLYVGMPDVSWVDKRACRIVVKIDRTACRICGQ